MAGINGIQKKKKEEDKERKEKYLWKIKGINKIKDNEKMVPLIIIFDLREKY